MKFLFEGRNSYQYKGYTVIQTSSGYRIKDGKGNWAGGEFDTDKDAKEHIDNLNESFEETSSYKFVSSKSVEDSDGFMTDYTWYEAEDGTHVFVFGDNDVYKPEDGYFDYTCDSRAEAQEWFDSYNGFADVDDEIDDFVVFESVEEDKPVRLKLSGNNMIEIPIEDNSEVGELGHPIQQGIGDPRAKREKELHEATAVLDKPLSTFQGTLSSVLLAHKDEVDTLFDRASAIEFLDRIKPEVKSQAYVNKVKQDILKSRNNPVEYFYNIILKGDGDGTEKGGVVTKKSKIRRWANESVSENKWEPGDSVTLWWDNPSWSTTSPCYASCAYWGKTRDGRYKFISDNYGWTFLLDVDRMTITTPQGKVHPVNNDSGWLKTNSLTENAVSSKLPEDIDDFLQELAQSQGLFDYNDISKYTPSDESLAKLRNLLSQYEDADEEESADIAKKCSEVIKQTLKESVSPFAHEVAIAMQHLMNDIGRDPTDEDFADDVVLEMEKSTPEDEIPTDPMKYREWASAIMCEVSRQLNALKESYNIQYYQIFSNPEKPTDNGKMIAQAGTEDEAKAKGNELVGKGNYLLKAVCDDGKVRDVDLHDYFSESRSTNESIDNWSLSVYNNDELLKDNIWSVSDALEFIHVNGGNIIKCIQNGEERIIWKDGKAVGGDFICMDYAEDGSTIYANDGDEVPTHEPLPPFDVKKWYYGEQLEESFNRIIDLDSLASDVANLLDTDVLGEENWIEVFPTSESRPVSSTGHLLPLEITGPNDDCRKATFTSRDGIVDVRFRNGSEAKCYSAEEIARFIAGEFGIPLQESIHEDFENIGSYRYKFIPEDWEEYWYRDIDIDVDEFDAACASGNFTSEMWLTSEAIITKEGRYYQVSWGGHDDYTEFSSIEACKSHVQEQYEFFEWIK